MTKIYAAILSVFLVSLGNSVYAADPTADAPPAHKQKKNLQTARILSTFHALQQLTNLLYQQHMLYSEPLKGQWLIAHQLYETAVQYKYHLININHIIIDAYSLTTFILNINHERD